MSAPISVWKGYVIPEMPWCITCWICDGLSAHDLARRYWTCTGCKPFLFGGPGDMTDTIAEAADAGRKHLREVHTPTVGTYCRAHGCHRDICGCGRSHTPKPPESRSDFVQTIPEGSSAIHAAHNLSREDC